MDEIRRRNRPVEAPKAPPKAPFFLPVKSGLDVSFDVEKKTDPEEPQDGDNAGSRILSLGRVAGERSDLCRLLEDASARDVLYFLQKCDPARIENEIQSLSMGVEDEDIGALGRMLRVFESLVEERTHFQTAQAYLGLFLKLHSRTIRRHASLSGPLRSLQSAQGKVACELEGLFQKTTCLSDFLSHFK
eukprot:g5198.t1